MALIVASCGGPQYDGQTFRNDEVAFRIGPPPSGWRTISADEALLAFRVDRQEATIAVNGRCHRDGDDVPLRALTHHLFLQFTDRKLIGEREMRLDGRAALETEMNAALDGVSKHFIVTVLKKDACVYDFLLIQDEAGSGIADEYRAFVQSFRTLD